MTMSEPETEMEYWCGWDQHWVPELRLQPTGAGAPVCEECAAQRSWPWVNMKPAVREKSKPRFTVAKEVRKDSWFVWDAGTTGIVDERLSETQAQEMADMRNRWEAEK